MRGIFERIVVRIKLTVFNRRDLLPDGDHRFAETVQFSFRLAFGGFDHQGAGHREAHRGGVEAKIHQPLGYIFHGDAGIVLNFAHVDDALVGNAVIGPFVKHRKMWLQLSGNVVGIQNGNLAGFG